MSSTTCKLVIKFCSYIPWLDTSKQTTNFVSMVKEAMRLCLVDFQEITLLANARARVCVEHLLSWHPSKSKSEYPMISKLSNFRLVSMHPFFSFQATQHTFYCFSVLHPRITQVSVCNSYNKCYVRMSTNLSVNQTSYYWWIKNILHLSSFKVVFVALFETQFVSFSYYLLVYYLSLWIYLGPYW